MMNTADNQQEELACVDDLAEPPSGGVKRSPGNMLRAQRETLELSVQQVSEQLNLTMHYLRCLESDSYDKLPGDVFVRGYIRAYSRLLRLDPDQVLMIYNEYNSHKIARKEEAIKRRNRRIQDRNRPWIIFSGIAFVAVAVALWYLSPAQTADTVADAGEADVVLEAAVSVLAASANRSTTAEAALPEGQRPVQSAEQSPELTLPILPDLIPDEVALAQLSPQAPEHTDNHNGHHREDAVSPIVQNWTGSDELTLHFKHDSWVEVEHKGGTEEHADIRHAGDTLTIYGTAPFAVLLGDARDVELSFNGRQIDISSNIRADNSARLSIGM